MELVMCLSCGTFVWAVKEDGQMVPQGDECLACGGCEFRHNATQAGLTTDGQASSSPG